jgi:hypothetical protein
MFSLHHVFFFEKLLGLHLVLPKDVSLILYHDLMKEQKR